jgi:hypothetical protein
MATNGVVPSLVVTLTFLSRRRSRRNNKRWLMRIAAGFLAPISSVHTLMKWSTYSACPATIVPTFDIGFWRSCLRHQTKYFRLNSEVLLFMVY